MTATLRASFNASLLEIRANRAIHTTRYRGIFMELAFTRDELAWFRHPVIA